MSVDLWLDLKSKLNMYFGTGSIAVLFLCALLFWVIRKEKSRQMRFYVYYVVIALVGMLNPVSLYVIDKTGNMEVYERFFWLLMTTCMLAFTFATFVHKDKKMLLPLLVLLLLCGRSVFTDTEYKTAENMEKISQEAVEVSEIIMRDFEGLAADAAVEPNRVGIASPRAVVTEPLSEDIRMYNANIELWYVRKNFGNFYNKSFRDVSWLMTMDNSEVPVDTLVKGMKKKDFQYFVLGNWQELIGDISKHDITLIGSTKNYRVYKYQEPEEYVLYQYADVEGYQCMSYLIRSNDGKIAIVDGGRAWQSVALVEEIKKYGGVVDTWIITHAHDDHAGVLASILEAEWDKTEIEIGEILIGEMDYDAVMAEESDRTDMVAYLQMGLDRLENVRVLKAGDERDVIGLHMKVLHTCNDTVVENSTNILNDGSMVFKLSAPSRSILFLADTADNTEQMQAEIADPSMGSKIGRLLADEILEAYPEDVKSWAVQMSHHGNGSYPDYFYEAIAPKRALFAAPDWLMENRNKETGETSYYSTPHYKQLMERLGAKVISYSSGKNHITLR